MFFYLFPQTTTDLIGTRAGQAMEASLQNICRDVLIPSFTQALQEMFQQLNAAHQQGLVECKYGSRGNLIMFTGFSISNRAAVDLRVLI